MWPEGVQTGSFAGWSDSAHHPKGNWASAPVLSSMEDMNPQRFLSPYEKTPYVEEPLFFECFWGIFYTVAASRRRGVGVRLWEPAASSQSLSRSEGRLVGCLFGEFGELCEAVRACVRFLPKAKK